MCVWVPRSAHLLLLPPSRQPGWIIYTISGRVFKIKGLQLGFGGRKCSIFFCIFGTIWMCLITVTASQHVALRSTISNTNIQPILSWQLKCLQACWSPSKTRTMCPRECVWQITKKMQEVSNSYAFILEARQVPVLPYADFCCLDVLLLCPPSDWSKAEVCNHTAKWTRHAWGRLRWNDLSRSRQDVCREPVIFIFIISSITIINSSSSDDIYTKHQVQWFSQVIQRSLSWWVQLTKTEDMRSYWPLLFFSFLQGYQSELMLTNTFSDFKENSLNMCKNDLQTKIIILQKYSILTFIFY